jgi:hypothetical protein
MVSCGTGDARKHGLVSRLGFLSHLGQKHPSQASYTLHTVCNIQPAIHMSLTCGSLLSGKLWLLGTVGPAVRSYDLIELLRMYTKAASSGSVESASTTEGDTRQ